MLLSAVSVCLSCCAAELGSYGGTSELPCNCLHSNMADAGMAAVKYSTEDQSKIKFTQCFFYCFTVHFDNIKIPFTNKCTLLLNT